MSCIARHREVGKALVQPSLFQPLGFAGLNPEKFNREWRERCSISHVGHREVDSMIKAHYLGKWPGVCVCTLGLWLDDALVGTSVFALPPTQANVRYGGETWELARLWISDNIPCNAESWMIAQSIRHVASSHPKVAYLLSYADPSVGHSGGIYRASNWTADGMTDDERKNPRCDYEWEGRIYSRKSHVPKGIQPNLIPRVRKHRFFYDLARHRKN